MRTRVDTIRPERDPEALSRLRAVAQETLTWAWSDSADVEMRVLAQLAHGAIAALDALADAQTQRDKALRQLEHAKAELALERGARR